MRLDVRVNLCARPNRHNANIYSPPLLKILIFYAIILFKPLTGWAILARKEVVMKKWCLNTVILLMVIVFVSVTPSHLSGQYFDYHREESPAITWNGLPLFDARMMGAGGVSFFASPAFSGIVNPALIDATAGVKGFNMGVTYERMEHEAFQYRGLNEGVFYSSINQVQENKGLSALALTFPFKKLYLSVGYYIANVPELPDFGIIEDDYQYTATFPGKEHRFFVAAAFKVSNNINLGIKLEYMNGTREVATDENLIDSGVRMQLEEYHKFHYFVPTIGLMVKLSSDWKLGLVWAQPLKGKAKRTLSHFFQSSFTQYEIIGTETDDTFYRPTNIHLSTIYTPFGELGNQGSRRFYLAVAGEAIYSMWSQYKYEFNSEEIKREMNNTMVIALGTEFGIAGKSNAYLLRLGYRFDPQPVDKPSMTLHAFTVGLGIRLNGISLDLAALIYKGSLDELSQSHSVINASIGIGLN
jgi:hypothetical protein